MSEDMNNNKWTVLAIVLLGVFMCTLDGSIVTITLPNMSTILSVGIETIQWVVTIYLMILSSLVLIFGRLADMKGKKTIFKYGFAIFALASLLCGSSNHFIFLVFSRAIQATGAAMMMASCFGIITMAFPETEKGRAIGFIGTVAGLGAVAGPPLGGLLAGLFGWKAIFLVNVPLGIFGFFAGAKIIPDDKNNKVNEPLDIKGATTFAIASFLLVWLLLSGEKTGWINPANLGSLAVITISLIMLYKTEKKIEYPLIDLSLFNNTLFTINIICAFISNMVTVSAEIIHPFYLQDILLLASGRAGVFMLALPILSAVVAPISGYLSDKLGSKIPALFGMIFMAAGIFLMAFLTDQSDTYYVLLGIGVLGIGNGLFQSPNNAFIMSLVPSHKLGIAGGINSLVRYQGMVFGIVFSVSLLYNRMNYRLGEHVNSITAQNNEIFLYAMKYVYLSLSLLAFIGILLTLTMFWKRKN